MSGLGGTKTHLLLAALDLLHQLVHKPLCAALPELDHFLVSMVACETIGNLPLIATNFGKTQLTRRMPALT